MSGNANKQKSSNLISKVKTQNPPLIVRANGCQCHPKTQGCVLHCQKCMVKKIYESVKVLVAKSMASVLNTLSSLLGLVFLELFLSFLVCVSLAAHYLSPFLLSPRFSDL